MKDIFVSRPNWIAPEFKQGLDKFIALIKTYELNPRTLGVSEYPTDSPLDEVIKIINQCVGVIILGYPQLYVEKGSLKGTAITSKYSVNLATEWNHIEAGLAYAKGLPLLVIHHTNVSRGIFDRGALNKFLYQVDLTSNNWASDEAILGAITAWRGRLLQKPLSESNISAQKGGLQFEPRSGTLISKTSNIRYCHKCYHSTPAKEVELQESPAGWTCSVCGNFFDNPNYIPPAPRVIDDSPWRM
jgi:hypothetical protein